MNDIRLQQITAALTRADGNYPGEQAVSLALSEAGRADHVELEIARAVHDCSGELRRRILAAVLLLKAAEEHSLN